jgi:hypothetical protein
MLDPKEKSPKFRANIHQIYTLNKELGEVFIHITQGNKTNEIEFLSNAISVFVMNCRYILNEGTLPSNPKKRLDPRTMKTLNKYISNWSKPSIELDRIQPSKPILKKKRYERHGYSESSENESVERTIVAHVVSKGIVEIRIKGVSRNY